MAWLKKHCDALMVIGAIFGACTWMNFQFNGIATRFVQLEKDMAVIKTVLIMKEVMPKELVTKEKK